MAARRSDPRGDEDSDWGGDWSDCDGCGAPIRDCARRAPAYCCAECRHALRASSPPNTATVITGGGRMT